MRSLWFAGATCGMAIEYLVYYNLGWIVASTTLVGVSIVSGILVVQEYRAARRFRQMREREFQRIRFYEQTGRWPTKL